MENGINKAFREFLFVFFVSPIDHKLLRFHPTQSFLDLGKDTKLTVL